MSSKSIKDILKDFGLAKNQAKIYIYLAKQGVLKGGEIAKQTKIPKAAVYRTLKVLQRKGFIESTLEFPARYIAVPFETILDYNIKAKKQEAQEIEKSKKDLLNDWKNISKGIPQKSVEKFTIIEKNQKIYNKIYQMIKQTKKEIISASTIQGLLLADRYGVFDAIHNHPAKSKIKFRFITDLTKSDLPTIKSFLNRMKGASELRGRNPELGIALFPRIVIRDHEELLLFISDKKNKTFNSNKQTCLVTNCKSIIQSYSGVFEDLWQNSTKIKQKIEELQTGKPSSKTQIIKDPIKAKKQYKKILSSAKKEIFIITSADGLKILSKNNTQIKKSDKKNISIKIMAPIINENLESSHKILQWAEVKHIPLGYFDTTIIDDKHLFQFNSQLRNIFSEKTNFENILYTTDLKYIKKTKDLIANIWRKTRTPGSKNLRLIVQSTKPLTSSGIHHSLEKKQLYLKNIQYDQTKKITKEYVLRKIKQEKKLVTKKETYSKTLRYFGSRAFVVIHPPDHFNLPDICIGIFHNDKDSSFGEENWLAINLEQKTKEGVQYIPTAWVLDNDRLLSFRKNLFKGFPIAEKNLIVLNRSEIQVQTKGKTLFAGWTKPIPLGISNFILPPSCLLFEGYGEMKSGVYTNIIKIGRRQEYWHNSYDAFVTFFHPKSKYIGSGTEGFIETDYCLISKPSKTDK